MADNETTEKKVEYISVETSLFPDFDGERIDRAFRIKKRLESLTFGLPVPRNEEEAKQYYGCELATLIEKGVKQMSYDKDSGIRKMLKDKPDASIESLTEQLQKDLPTLPSKKERKQVAKKEQALGRQVKDIAEKLNLTTEEVIKRLQSMPTA